MSTIITSIDSGSPAMRAGLRPGQQLLSINGHTVVDVLDYRFYGYDPVSHLTLKNEDGSTQSLTIHKDEGEDLGLNFDTYLMDEMRSCANHCIFCFVDQMPPGMRETLYFKDDDARLSFLQGNYITLTNLTEREAQRIIDLRISPINVSVHTTDPKLHCTMLGNKNAERSLDYIRAFCKAGIVMNGQIVICPGWNDGDQLRRTLRDLTEMQFSSCSLVPVGITKYRQGLAKLKPVDARCAGEILDIAEEFGQENLRRFGTRRFFCADEEGYYEGYRQLENGVGMLRSLESDLLRAMDLMEDAPAPTPFTIATGRAAESFMGHLLDLIQERFPQVQGRVIGIDNDFFGHTIDVAGLLTGQDLAAQLKKHKPLGRVLIPLHMLRHQEDVFLDDWTVPQLSQALETPVQVVGIDGFDLCDAVFEL